MHVREREERSGKQRKVSDMSDQVVPPLPPLPNVENERSVDADQPQPRPLPPRDGGRDNAVDSVVDLTKVRPSPEIRTPISGR